MFVQLAEQYQFWRCPFFVPATIELHMHDNIYDPGTGTYRPRALLIPRASVNQ